MAYYLLSIEPVIVDDSWDFDRDAFHLEYCHIWFQLMCSLKFRPPQSPHHFYLS